MALKTSSGQSRILGMTVIAALLAQVCLGMDDYKKGDRVYSGAGDFGKLTDINKEKTWVKIKSDTAGKTKKAKQVFLDLNHDEYDGKWNFKKVPSMERFCEVNMQIQAKTPLVEGNQARICGLRKSGDIKYQGLRMKIVKIEPNGMVHLVLDDGKYAAQPGQLELIKMKDPFYWNKLRKLTKAKTFIVHRGNVLDNNTLMLIMADSWTENEEKFGDVFDWLNFLRGKEETFRYMHYTFGVYIFPNMLGQQKDSPDSSFSDDSLVWVGNHYVMRKNLE